MTTKKIKHDKALILFLCLITIHNLYSQTDFDRRKVYTITNSALQGGRLDSTSNNYFPHNVGDRWEYVEISSGRVTILEITKDSIGTDSSDYVFFNFDVSPYYRIDPSLNVFELPYSENYLRYKLNIDTCSFWFNPQSGSQLYSWMAVVETVIFFSKQTIAKRYKYGPGNPCGSGALEEHQLAKGFGLVYKQREPYEIYYLRGCIVAGDTFGIITSVKQRGNEIPTSFMVKQNYPNPFNPSTRIDYDLSGSGDIRITVYDILGRKVETLVDGRQQAGSYSIQWNAKGISSGLYFCRFMYNGNNRILKMVLTK